MCRLRFINCKKKKKDFYFAGEFPAFDNITETWCRGCGTCNSSTGVQVKLTRFIHIQVHLFKVWLQLKKLKIFLCCFFFFFYLTGIPVVRKHFKVQVIFTKSKGLGTDIPVRYKLIWSLLYFLSLCDQQLNLT